jgi:uncharacterized protein (DUF1800 family)
MHTLCSSINPTIATLFGHFAKGGARTLFAASRAIACCVALIAPVALTHAAPADVSADNRSDLLYADGSGAINLLLMDGVFSTSPIGLLPAGSGWMPTHVADLNADGKADIFVKNTDGRIAVMMMNGATVSSFDTLLGPGSGWSISHVADFDGNGKPDLLIKNADGRLAVLMMNGASTLSFTPMVGVGSPYSVALVADLNGDGKMDVLLKHTDGTVVVLLMNGPTASTATNLLTAGTPWSVTHAADLNGDGKADLILKHTDGSAAILLMNGATVASAAYLLTAGSPYTVTHTGDFNGDGKADLVIKHTDKSVITLLMNGTAVSAATYLLTPNSPYTVLQIGDYDGDNKSDVLLRSSDGTVTVALMNGGAVKSAGVLWGAGSRQVVPGEVFGNRAVSPLADAARLLSQATFGATLDDINRASSIGPAAWIEEQFAKPQTLHLTTVRNDPNYPAQPWGVLMPSIWKQYFEGDDQLRQRMAFALSQIMVISNQNNRVGDQACAGGAYLDMLGRNAFGNFKDLLRQVTLSPAMGEYLDMKGSAKAYAPLNSIPSENYARELLQLFSIGTVMLNQDGSVQFGANGKPIETYSEEAVQEFARALTGWTFASQDQTKSWRWLYPDVPYPSPSNPGSPEKACVAWSSWMEPWTATYRSADDKADITGGAHDTGAKTLLTYPGSDSFKKNVPAGQTPQQDLDDVITNIFNHPNIGPFIGEQLIQRLVTSNPSGGYVARVAAAFNNNGAGTRGDMRAVVRAILLDPEARAPITSQSDNYGKLREPVIRFVHFHRAFGARPANGSYAHLWDFSTSDALGQNPLRAGSVFNFYHPDFAPSGRLSQAGLVGPEFEITNSATLSGFMDFSKWAIINGFGQYESDTSKWIKPNYDTLISLAPTPAALVDTMNILLMSGSMSDQFRSSLIDVATKLTDSNAATQSAERVKTLLWLILNSPEYSIQK